jgi:AmmeMemoRadiSam system protein B
MSVRPPAVAGMFYPEEKGELARDVKKYLADAKEMKLPAGAKLRALVEPHAGYIYSGPVAAFGYKMLAANAKGISKVLLLGPSHHVGFVGAAEAGYETWETPLGVVKAGSIQAKLSSDAKRLIHNYPQAHEPEHCLEVQLPFLQVVLKGKFEIYPILCCEVDPKSLADALAPIIDGKTLIIASSDLSHYLPYESAKRIDAVANDAVPALDIAKFEEAGDACGKMPILVLMHIAKKKGWKGMLLDYRNSGDTAGDKSQVVGYGCYAFYEK